MNSRSALLTDGSGRAVGVRVGGNTEGQDRQSGGGSVRVHPEAGQGTATFATAEGRRQRVLQSRVDDSSEDPSFLHQR